MSALVTLSLHYPARGRKPLVALQAVALCLGAFAPLPRKGTETRCTLSTVARLTDSFRSITPQGDGNPKITTTPTIPTSYGIRSITPQGDGNISTACSVSGAEIVAFAPLPRKGTETHTSFVNHNQIVVRRFRSITPQGDGNLKWSVLQERRG